MKRVAVLLSGCGVYDGSEIHEAVLTLLALDKSGATTLCVAPDIQQYHVIDHAAGAPEEGQTRRVLTEAARIARGAIRPLGELRLDEYDAMILVGGYGAAKNLCSFGYEGADYAVNPEVAAAIQGAHQEGKPLGFMCIAPAVAAGVLGSQGIQLTIGNDADTAAALSGKGAVHVESAVTDIVVDEGARVVTTPAYMYDARISEVEVGISKLVNKVLELAAVPVESNS